jgi:hypothetical protein
MTSAEPEQLLLGDTHTHTHTQAQVPNPTIASTDDKQLMGTKDSGIFWVVRGEQAAVRSLSQLEKQSITYDATLKITKRYKYLKSTFKRKVKLLLKNVFSKLKIRMPLNKVC